jgi:3,4-dihydroxy 2-butanone 4-phosphate synthase/GTP cyclohydrolase II
MMMQDIVSAIQSIKNGKMIIITDAENRENEGDLVIAAEKIEPHHIAFMMKYGSGLICLPMTKQKLDQLGIPMMVPEKFNNEPHKTAFTVSIDAANGITTGISACDRARTIMSVINDDAKPQDIVMPGHLFPLLAREGGVFERAGHTEASIELATMAGLKPISVICEIIGEDGAMLRGRSLKDFAARFNLPIISIENIIKFKQNLINNVGISTITPIIKLPTKFGAFNAFSFIINGEQKEHFVIYRKKNSFNNPLVRIHSECLTGDVFGSCRCDCNYQLHASLKRIAEEGEGIIIYLRQEGRGIGLIDKLRAYKLQEKGLDTVDANVKLGLSIDNREYDAAFSILKYLKIGDLRLMTNNPEKIKFFKNRWDGKINREPIIPEINLHNAKYIKTKIEKLNHLIRI